MNQLEATETIADYCLERAFPTDAIYIVTPTESDHSPVIICRDLDGTWLSVTVEILAQP